MSEEKKVVAPVEIEEDELDLVAGGAYVDGDKLNYRCGFCGQTIVVNSMMEAMAHVKACPKNPNNF